MGAGLDSPSTNESWADTEDFQFELWTDEDKTLGVTYGALSSASDSSVRRVTMLLDEKGELVLEYTMAIDVGTHPALVLEDCETLFGK